MVKITGVQLRRSSACFTEWLGTSAKLLAGWMSLKQRRRIVFFMLVSIVFQDKFRAGTSGQGREETLKSEKVMFWWVFCTVTANPAFGLKKLCHDIQRLFLQYAKDGKRESYSCPSLLRQDNTSEVTVSESQRVIVSSLLIISCLLCGLVGPVMRAFQFHSQTLVGPLLSVWSDLTGTDDLRESSPRYD